LLGNGSIRTFEPQQIQATNDEMLYGSSAVWSAFYQRESFGKKKENKTEEKHNSTDRD
jgi:hypothetical protein